MAGQLDVKVDEVATSGKLYSLTNGFNAVCFKSHYFSSFIYNLKSHYETIENLKIYF